MQGTRVWRRRAVWLCATLAVASVTVGCRDTGDGGGAAVTPGPVASSKTPDGDAGKGGGKESATPAPDASKTPGGEPAGALTCAQLRNAELQNAELRLPDAPEGTIAFTDGRWESGDGVVVELQPQCGVGDMTGDPAADAVAAVKVTTGGTGRFYTLVTWRNDAGTPVPAAAVPLGDRTPVESVEVSAEPARQATVVYLTRGDTDPAAVVTIRRTAVYRVAGPAMAELHHSDAPYTP
ncbi:hypothetical protein [Streptomyces sp. t39]|uniref:hypothetical protein n=1 Tax=Streptomyces sp. t39 TaxID=1828156 RepID=UPI0011CEC7F2|nr:hypothetical protein [Streptomyces sp. t39]TXS52924.1 hypothetical protein EAO77_19085 [Streptomyces sp. t39]